MSTKTSQTFSARQLILCLVVRLPLAHMLSALWNYVGECVWVCVNRSPLAQSCDAHTQRHSQCVCVCARAWAWRASPGVSGSGWGRRAIWQTCCGAFVSVYLCEKLESSCQRTSRTRTHTRHATPRHCPTTTTSEKGTIHFAKECLALTCTTPTRHGHIVRCWVSRIPY